LVADDAGIADAEQTAAIESASAARIDLYILVLSLVWIDAVRATAKRPMCDGFNPSMIAATSSRTMIGSCPFRSREGPNRPRRRSRTAGNRDENRGQRNIRMAFAVGFCAHEPVLVRARAPASFSPPRYTGSWGRQAREGCQNWWGGRFLRANLQRHRPRRPNKKERRNR
jgi:hypothetical protein